MLGLCQDKRYACLGFISSSEFMIYVSWGTDISAIIHLVYIKKIKINKKQILKNIPKLDFI